MNTILLCPERNQHAAPAERIVPKRSLHSAQRCVQGLHRGPVQTESEKQLVGGERRGTRSIDLKRLDQVLWTFWVHRSIDPCSVTRVLLWSVGVKKELSQKAALQVYWSVCGPTVTCGHEVGSGGRGGLPVERHQLRDEELRRLEEAAALQ